VFAPLLFTVFTSAVNVRAKGDRAVERARYAFVLEANRPFDEVYPPSVFQARARQEMLEERVLSQRFGLSVTPAILAAEFDRIERETKARDQWEAIKRALGGDRGRIEDIYCRPLLVDRALHARFDFDQQIHAAAHEKARRAQAEFLARRKPAGARSLALSRIAEVNLSTDEMLSTAKAWSQLPAKIEAPAATRDDQPIPLSEKVRNVLERELKSPGDVTTILEEPKGFVVYRLVAITPSEWRVDAVGVPKMDFDSWFEREGRGSR
jgi:hypothetical protein